MANPRRQPNAPLGEALFEQARRFDFFQVVRLLGRLFPARRPVGGDHAPADEVVRFKTRPTLAFLPGPVQGLKPPTAEDQPADLTTSVLTLTGPTGALPFCYTELLLERLRDRDHTMAAFLDVFHHRLISLFYRAWEKHRPALTLERAWDEQRASRDAAPSTPPPRPLDPFSAHIFAMVGLGMEPLRDRHDFPDEAILYYVGLFAQRHRSAVALEAILGEFFALPIEVVQFVEHKLRLEPADRSVLGRTDGNSGLGVDLIMGDQVTDVAGKFRLRIGPLPLRQFRALSPDQPLFRRLVQMTRLFIDAPLVFDVQVVLRAEDVPACQMFTAPGVGARLGRDSWVKSVKSTRDADDPIYDAGV